MTQANQFAHPSVLREWTVDDGPWYVAQLGDSQLQRFTTESVTTTLRQFSQALDDMDIADDGWGRAIQDPDTGELAGNLAASFADDVAKISYWLAEPFRGRGLATRAVSEALSWIHRNWPGTQVATLSIREGNVASEAVASRLGFKRDPCRDERIQVRGDFWNMQAWSRTQRAGADN
ncbi:MAG: GNAT family N-acetyltransferase [Nocardioidaceae bacterium]